MPDIIYEVKTNLPPEAISRIGLAIFAEWVNFAMGRAALGGKLLGYPTGRYASAIQYRQEGIATVAILADPSTAPEASILETGHKAVDLKKLLTPGRAYKMHRPPGANPFGLLRVGSGPPSMRPRMWAAIRKREASGFASFGPNSDPDSWIIPAMSAYAPAYNLSLIAAQMAAGSTK